MDGKEKFVLRVLLTSTSDTKLDNVKLGNLS
jgi:hypothetical protein